ncbi:MAG: DUF2007 domain-containing protein, partial [Marinobacter sp.]|nr:DUF2007 domain-containing protein [Marinobacter sp.]
AGFSNVHVEDEDLYRARELIREYEQGSPTVTATSPGQDKPDQYARWFLLALIVTVWLLVQLY